MRQICFVFLMLGALLPLSGTVHADLVNYHFTATINSDPSNVGYTTGQTVTGSFGYYSTICTATCTGGATLATGGIWLNTFGSFQSDAGALAMTSFNHNNEINLLTSSNPTENITGFQLFGTNIYNDSSFQGFSIDLFTSQADLLDMYINNNILPSQLPDLVNFDLAATVEYHASAGGGDNPTIATAARYSATLTSLTQDVPEPASVALFAPALVGLVGLRRLGPRRA